MLFLSLILCYKAYVFYFLGLNQLTDFCFTALLPTLAYIWLILGPVVISKDLIEIAVWNATNHTPPHIQM